MLKETLKKFDYPNSLIKEYKHWLLLLCKEQVTLGAMILICKETEDSFHAISKEAMQELSMVTKDVEQGVKKSFNNDKINFIIRVDSGVHFHIIPRYSSEVVFLSHSFQDLYWPVATNLSHNPNPVNDQMFILVRDEIKMNLDWIVPKKKYNRMYTSGCFDLFHYGHLNIFKQTKELCDYLVVGVSTDELILKSKGKKPVIPFEERVKIISSIKYVDEVIPQVDKNKQKVVDMYGIDAISVGDDWRGKYPPVSCEMEYFPYTPSVSSTILKNALKLLND